MSWITCNHQYYCHITIWFTTSNIYHYWTGSWLYPVFLFPPSTTAEVSFVNNIARYGNNAVYFTIFKYCDIIVNSSDVRSIMNVPYQFNYSQIINGTLTHIPIDFNYVLYTWLNVTQFPVVTSPHRLVLWSDKIPVLSPILIHRETMVSKIQCVITH